MLREDLVERLHRVRVDALLAVQSGVAAGLAWFVAHDLMGHSQPFFAPISAVVVLGASVGQRWRRAWELVFGVALGIAVGDALILVIGVGVVQIALVVTLAILLTVFLGGGSVAMGQAAASAVLVATLAPPTGGVIYFDRFFDSLAGGGVGILVMALLLPFNPLTRVRRAAGQALTTLDGALAQVAQGLVAGDAEVARAALTGLRASEGDQNHLQETLDVGRETATLAPMRWRARPALNQYMDAAVHIDRATRNARVLARRATVLIEDGEPAPPALAQSLNQLAEAVRTLDRQLAQGDGPGRTRQAVLTAVGSARVAYVDGVGFSGSTVIAQIRSAATDLLRAAGMDHDTAHHEVRAVAAGREPGPDPGRGPGSQ